MTATVLAGFVAGASLIIAIGAQNAFVLRQALQQRHVGLVVALCVGSDILLIACGVAGVGAVVGDSPVLLQVMRFGGAAFVGWYGFRAARRALRGTSALGPLRQESLVRSRVVLACLAFTFLNPHTYLDTMVLLGSLSTRYASPWAFALGACTASALWFALLGFGGKLLIPVFRRPVAWRVLDAAMAVFMLALCGMLLARPLGA